MAANDPSDDAYVARLLEQDALTASKKYDFVGMDAFKRARPEASKPNTNFLRHIIRQTDSHNAALLAREAKDSRARLRKMDTARDNRYGRDVERHSTPPLSDPSTGNVRGKRRARTRTSSDSEPEYKDYKKSRRVDVARDVRSHRDGRRREDRGRHRESSTGKTKDRRQYSDQGRERGHRSRGATDDGDSLRCAKRVSHEHGRRRRTSRSRSRRRSPSPASDRRSRAASRRHRSRSPVRSPRSPPGQIRDRRNRHNVNSESRRVPTSEDESDPLEALVGPLPPQKTGAVRSRGRGTHGSNSGGIEARFSSGYNPALDVYHGVNDGDGDGDEWSDAVEAFRDRQRWKQQGAERLKAAGFSEEQVQRWERGDEKNEEDVQWTAQGKAREWDRGKTVDADGDVGFKAAWTGER